jgi:tetratricopeptide (TPR) repeat protein
MPVANALERCRELLNEATDRAGQANVLAFMGGLEAIDGRFEDARLHEAEAATTYEEIGELYALANNSGRVLGRIEMLAGDPLEAERTLRQCCATLERMHDEASVSTVAAELADALYAQERYEEARGWLDIAEKKAPEEDVSAQYNWRRVRAKVLARDGAYEDAEALARQAAEIAGRTDALSDHGTVLLDFAEVLLLSDKESDAAGQYEHGLRLFEQKGDRVSANATRALLNELSVA